MILSFIIIEYYSVKEILNCYATIVKSMKNISYDFEIIVSSNSVYEFEKQKQLLSEYPQFRWNFNVENGGFAYAMNQGLKIARGEVLVIMNPDVKLKFGIESMVDFLTVHKEIGLIAPVIRNISGEIQDSYRHFITPWRFGVRHLGRVIGKSHPKVYDNPVKVDWVCGAFMMMSRASYESTKGLDDSYFLYCEDMDLCKRMQLKGYEVVYYPMAEIEYEGTRSARKSWKYACIFLKSLLRYWMKFGFS